MVVNSSFPEVTGYPGSCSIVFIVTAIAVLPLAAFCQRIQRSVIYHHFFQIAVIAADYDILEPKRNRCPEVAQTGFYPISHGNTSRSTGKGTGIKTFCLNILAVMFSA